MAAHVCASSGMVAAILNQVPLSFPAYFSVVNMLLEPDLFWSTKLSGRLLPGSLWQVLLLHTQLCIVSNVQDIKYAHTCICCGVYVPACVQGGLHSAGQSFQA